MCDCFSLFLEFDRYRRALAAVPNWLLGKQSDVMYVEDITVSIEQNN